MIISQLLLYSIYSRDSVIYEFRVLDAGGLIFKMVTLSRSITRFFILLTFVLTYLLVSQRYWIKSNKSLVEVRTVRAKSKLGWRSVLERFTIP